MRAKQIEHDRKMQLEAQSSQQTLEQNSLKLNYACFQHHQLAAVVKASLKIFQMTLGISHTSKEWEEKVTFLTLCLRLRGMSQKWYFC